MASIPMTTSWQRRRLVSQASDAHVGWRNQCSAVWITYSYWVGAGREDATSWYDAYLTALDQEERAAERYAGLIGRLDELVAPDLQPMPESAVPANRR
jgi:hypothetical protein